MKDTKSSLLMLVMIAREGGEISATQFQKWLGELMNSDLIRFVKEGEGAGVKFKYVLTEKALKKLKEEGLS